jgi:hypothetical protein
MMVNLAEILKGNQWAVETSEPSHPPAKVHASQHCCSLHVHALKRPVHAAGIRTGLDVVAGAAAEGGPNAWPKAKMEIVLQKSPQFDALMAGGGAAGGRGGAASRQGQAQARERRQQQQQQQQVAQQQGQASGSGEGSSSGARQGAAAPRAGTEPAGGAAGGGGAGSSSSGRAAPQLGSSAGPSGEGTTPDVAPTSGPSP